MTTEKTKVAYRKLASHFYEKQLGGELPTPKKLADALAGCAHQYRPAYWRRLRGALAFDQKEKGYHQAAERIASTRNPMTTTSAGQGIIDATLRGETPRKQRRVKSVSSEDRVKLWEGAKALDDRDETCAAILLAETLGVRPVEMLALSIDEERGQVHVVGAKKSGGLRGADRILTLPDDPRLRKNIAIAARVIQRAESQKEGVIHRIQSRLERLTFRLWPRRKARPTLYSFRHQMGGDLKALGLPRAAIAYVMGHQSTQSVEAYGDRRKASSGGIKISITGQEAKAFQGRENHREPHAPHESKPAVAPAAQVKQAEAKQTSVPGPGASGPS